jgi:hypothetical protein
LRPQGPQGIVGSAQRAGSVGTNAQLRGSNPHTEATSQLLDRGHIVCDERRAASNEGERRRRFSRPLRPEHDHRTAVEEHGAAVKADEAAFSQRAGQDRTGQ